MQDVDANELGAKAHCCGLQGGDGLMRGPHPLLLLIAPQKPTPTTHAQARSA